MGWFTRKKKVEIPETDELWIKCKSCEAYIYKEEWIKNINVCPKCNFHDSITWQQRLALTIDEGTFEEFDADIKPLDPLHFVDIKGSYAEKAEESARKLGINEAIVTGRGKINGMMVVIGIMDFRFIGGSLGSGVGEKIALAGDHALRHRFPFVIFSSSGGARMQEGVISLMQMAKTCATIKKLKKVGIPYISVMTYPTTGGVSASFASVGDLNIAEPGALIGFAGRRVIEQTIKEKLPKDFQTAEFLLEHGFVDKIVNRKDMKEFLFKILSYWQG